MNPGEKLKTTAIVGTAQKEPDLSGFEGKLGETLTKLESTDKERLLLTAAAVFAIWQTAGKALRADPQNAPEIAESETGKILSGGLKQIFEALLDSSENGFLPEFLCLMVRRRKIIPPELLPRAFALGTVQLQNTARVFRHRILPVAGNRGKWLARQNPEWQWFLVEETGESLFETGRMNERVFALEYFRKKTPEKALEMLETVWQCEAARERQKFLEVLQINLSKRDENFLDEVFRTDKSAEVKRTAFELLANLPDSGLSREITEMIRPVLSVKKKLLVVKELDIELPNDWKEKTAHLKSVATQVFGDRKNFGEKALALSVGLSVINPQIWEDSLNLNPEDIAALAYKSEWAHALLAGFGMASMRFGNEAWFSAVLKYSSKNDLAANPLFVWSAQSLELIPEAKIFPLICVKPDYAFTEWIFNHKKFDSEETARFIEQNDFSPTKFTNVEINSGWKSLAFILPFSMIEIWISELEKMKTQNAFNENQKKLFDDVIETLKYRKDYILEFEK